MPIVECPECTLRFEPDEMLPVLRKGIYCPQCGNVFEATSPDPRRALRAVESSLPVQEARIDLQ